MLIVDAASQCNPDQVLPLFARARKVVIVGDAKQLSNEDLRRTLSGDANRALIHQAGLAGSHHTVVGQADADQQSQAQGQEDRYQR